ncbi:hypothetical protein JTB14_031273 [Gonioctena quinquepunctata]|nr:hypothetical protein JTB14_031273 [Gonioctena quinquepunctata]
MILVEESIAIAYVNDIDLHIMLGPITSENNKIRIFPGQEKITTVTSKITFLENENSLLKKRVPDLERRGKKYNLIVYGVEETSENPSEELLEIVKDVLKINSSIHNYRDIFRVGKPSTEKTRPIVAEVLCYDLKSQILNAANLLKDDLRKLGVIFSEDYAKEEYIRRKFSYNQLKLAKSTYPEARLKNDQLYLNNEGNAILSYDELLEKNERSRKRNPEKRNSKTHLRTWITLSNLAYAVGLITIE